MLRVIAVLFAGLFAASVAHAQPANPNPDVTTAVEGNNQFAFDLYARLAQKPGNTFFSPYSISNALGMTYAGAKGQTATEMAQTLHFTLAGDKLHPALGDVIRQLQGKDKDRPFKLSTVNRLWAQNGLAIRAEFMRITQTDYQSGLQQLDFLKDPESGRKTINQWVEEQTNNKIKDLLQKGTITPGTRLVLTNAIYFKADWLSPFTKEATRPEDFTIPGTPAFKVPMMNQVLHPAYLATDDFQLVRLPYRGHEVSMVVILPKKIDGLAEVEKKLSAKSLHQNVADAKIAHVALTMPKFKMTKEFKLNDELVAMGMPTAFSNQADFSGMVDSSSEKLKIDAVIHKAFVEVDEKGTEAAAATAVVMVKSSAIARPPEPPIPFRADHPFLFVIQHNATGSILFLGRVNDPR